MNWLGKLAIAAVAVGALGASVVAQEVVQPEGTPISAPDSGSDAIAHLQAASSVKLRALDKITGNWTDINAKVGQSITHGRIKVTVRACYQSPPQDAPESAAFLEVYSLPKEGHDGKPVISSQMNKGPQPIGENGLLFSGWMFASSPGLNALEHPTYDIWVISCITSAPQ